MWQDKLKEIIYILENSDVNEIEATFWGKKFRVVKNSPNILGGTSDKITTLSPNQTSVSDNKDELVSDKENERIISIQRQEGQEWHEGDSLYISGYPLGLMYAGDFTNDEVQDVMMIGESNYAIIQFAGERVLMDEKQSWRSHEERRVQHEFAIGDVNSDGYTDMASLDAGEQMLEIFAPSP